MSATENLTVHSRWAEAENKHDLAQLEDFLHPDIEEHLSASEVIVGIDACRASLHAVFKALPDFQTVLDDRFATDDRVMCRSRTSGTTKETSTVFRPPASASSGWASAFGSLRTVRLVAAGSCNTWRP